MPFRVFASAAILDARMGTDAGFAKNAHRAVFDYTPREGYLYVRSRAISSRCNDNFDMFPAEEIEKSYLTFIGKPVFVNHHNDDHRRARGVVIDAALHKDRNPDGSPDTWAEVLMEVDAVRFPRLAKAILAGEVDRTSMGCDVQLSKCSICHNVASSPLQYCAHIPGKKGKKIYKLDPRTGQKTAQLVFEICSGLSFFENSLLVEAPADPTAYFLGNVEVGPGLEHLTAGMNKTATRKIATEPLRGAAQHGVENDFVRSFEGRDVPDSGHPVSVYRDLSGAPKSGYPARGSWSIKRQRKNGSPDSHVVAHTVGLHITDPRPRFYEAAREHFKEQEKRGVHAFINGHVSHYDHPLEPGAKPEGDDWRQVSYYPDISHFFYTDTRNKFHGADEGAFRGGQFYVRGNHQEGDDGPVPQSKFEKPKTGKVWAMIHEAQTMGDDLFDWDFVVQGFVQKHAITKDDMDEWHKQNTAHPRNIVHLYHAAVDHGFFRGSDLPKPSDDHIVQNGHDWYLGMHHVGNALASAAHHSLGLNEHGHHDPELARNRTFGALAVYSEGTDVPMNYHQAAISTRLGKGISSGNSGLSPHDQAREFGTVNYSGNEQPGKPKSTFDQEKKVNQLYLPTTRHFHEVVKAPKTNNYGHLGYHGGDEPGTTYSLDQIHSGQNGRVVVDRHAMSGAIGRRIDGVDFAHAGLSDYKSSKKNPLAHQEGEFGKDANKHYSYVADAYRVAAQHLSNHYGTTIAPHQVQAVAWAMQRHLNENGHLTHPQVSDRRSTWKKADEDTWQGVVNAKHGWINDPSSAEKFPVPTQFKNRPNDRNRNNWEGHVDRNPDIGEAIKNAFPHGPRGHWGKKLAYGETKSPEDVDTLRSENCTVCGNSSAWDGTQCQVCGYVAPPRPFGDPDTDVARNKDIRKQVLEGTEADPNDPEQQLGLQQGDPGELEDQQDAAAAGEDTQLGTLTCNVCGTGVQPAAPTSESDGEPPYPADGDVCPVCKKGQLLSASDEQQLGDEAEMDSEDAEEGQEGDAPGGASQQELEEDDGDEDMNDESKGRSDASDDDDQDDGDSFDPKKKADNKGQKTSSLWPSWFKPVWMQ